MRSTDREAGFTAFVTEERAVLGRLAVLLSANRSDADDLLQEALARTYANWHKVDRDRAVGYVRRIMSNLVIDSWRRRKETLPITVEKPDARAASDLRHIELRDEIVRRLATLSSRERSIVVLRYYADMPEADVAVELGVTVGTVKSTASRALAKLRAEAAGESARTP